MTMTLLDRPATSASTSTPAQRLRTTTAAVRVSLRWLGVRKSLTQEQRSQAAETFHAESDFLSARKKLLDTSHPAYKEVTAVRGRVISYWRGVSLPFPEAGTRLIRQNQVEPFDHQMEEFREQLGEAVTKLDDHYAELKATARRRLGSLFNGEDYPPTLSGLFDISWDYPSVEPPPYLLQLSPAIYEQERSRVVARFEEAVTLAEQAFVSELAKLVSHLTERLGGTTDGERRVFRDSAISNLTEFFERFKQLNVRSNDQLDDLVVQAQRVIRGVEPQALRDNNSLRQQVASQLAGVQAHLDGMMVDRPRRNIIRSRQQGGS